MSESPATSRPTTVARVLPWGVALGAPFAALAAMSGLQDHDYFWHVTTGRLITTLGLLRTDPFSFTYPDGDWILHEWLGEVVLHLGVEALGTAGLIAAFSTLLTVILIVMSISIGRSGGGVWGTAAGLLLAGLATIPYVALRPLMISLVVFAVLILILQELGDGRMRPAIALPPLFVLWVNTHGFWSLGLGILALYIGASWLGQTAVRAERVRLTFWGGLAALATLVTPYGFDNLLYPLRYVDSGDWGLAKIFEWQSPDFHEPTHWPLLAMMLVLALLRGRSRQGWLELCAWLAIAGSLYAVRITPIAAILSGHVVALALSRPASDRRLRVRPRATQILDWGLAGVVAIASSFVLLRASEAAAIVNPALVPVDAVNVLAERDPAGRVLADYAWGGYVIYRLSDAGGTVFVDGRNDMYPQRVLDDYLAITSADPGAVELLDAYGVTAILMPPDAPLIRMEITGAGWCRAYATDMAVLLLREPCERASAVRQHFENADRVGFVLRLTRQPVGAVPVLVNRRATLP